MNMFTRSVIAWGTDAFEAFFKEEVQAMAREHLPLQKGLQYSSAVSDEPIRLVVLSAQEAEGALQVHCGVFYSGTIAGCNCSDDPTPPDTVQEYCEVQLNIAHSGELLGAALLEE